MTDYTSERTAEINAAADAISALAIGDGASIRIYSDILAGTVISRTAATITVQEDHATLDPSFKPTFDIGGFAGHCINQNDQTYTYSRNPNGATFKITLRRWKDDEGNERRRWKRVGCSTYDFGGNVYVGRQKFHDYNF